MRFTISLKIILASSVLMFFATIMGLSSIYISSSSANISRHVDETLVPGTNAIMGASVSALTAMREVLAFTDSGNETNYENAMEQFTNGEEFIAEFEGLLSSEEAASLVPDALEYLPSFKETFVSYKDLSVRSMELYRELQKINLRFFKMSEDIINQSNAIYKYNIMEALNNLRQNVLQKQTRRLNLAITASDITELIHDVNLLYSEAVNRKSAAILPQIQTKLKNISSAIDKLKKTGSSENDIKMISRLSKTFGDSVKLANNAFKTLEDFEKIDIPRKDAVTRLRELSSEIDGIMISKSLDVSMTATSELSQGETWQIGLLAVIMAFGAAIMIFNNYTVSRPLKKFVGTVGELTSGDGDLTKRVISRNNDELADLAGNFNRFIENVQMIVTEVKSSTDEVASGNNQLAATMEELSTTFDSQSKQITEIVESMSAISNISRSTADALTKNTGILGETTDETLEGQGQLDKAREGVVAIKEQAESLSSTITRLSESSSQIGDILITINDIADQTNLLALNAAIEAARAGEAGRGFAVVADEVRKLAERTQKATSEIETIITSLQKESEAASNEMNNAAESVQKGVEIITETTEGFKRVVESVTSVREDSKSVSKAVADQYNTIQNVNDNTQVIASGIEESNAAVNEVTSTVAHLQERTERLKSLVGRFRV